MSKRNSSFTVTFEKHGTWLALVLASLFFIQGLLGNQHKSLTWDEPSYISAGYSYLKWNDFRLNPSHPPLMQDLAALPLLFMDLKVPPREDPGFRNNINPVVEFGRRFLFESGNDFRRITFWARLPVLVIGSLLIMAIFLWGRQLYGPGPALLATTMGAFCPNLIAHAKVATEDLGCSALMFMAVWMLWRALERDSVSNWLLCGLVTGLALISKYTALLLGPIFILLVIGYWWLRRALVPLLRLVRGSAVVAAVSLFVVGASYNLSFDYSIYLDGIKKLYTDYPAGMQYYLYGRVFDEPIWYYYLAAFLVKVPVPTILLLGLAIFMAVHARRFAPSFFFLLVPPAMIILVSFFDRHNLGLRRILPAFPFLILFISSTALGTLGRTRRSFIIFMLVWLLFEAWNIYPHHLSYFNTFAGGPKRGPCLLDDSNIDWGQDLPALAAWQKLNYSGKPIKLFYNGSADPVAYGVNPLQMDEQEIMFPQPGIYAISAHYLVFFRTISINEGYDVDWLTKYRPVAYTGNSIYIYSFPPRSQQE